MKRALNRRTLVSLAGAFLVVLVFSWWSLARDPQDPAGGQEYDFAITKAHLDRVHERDRERLRWRGVSQGVLAQRASHR